MNDPRRHSRDNRMIEAAVRRAVGVRFARPSVRSLRRSCVVYANVIAAVVAFGLPTAGAVRHAAGSAMAAFEVSVRNFGDLSSSTFSDSADALDTVTESMAGAPDVPVAAPAVRPLPDVLSPAAAEQVIPLPADIAE